MDVVSQLIEENVRRTQDINCILDKNQSQINNFKLNTEVLEKQNYYSESIINSFSSIYGRIKGWFYKQPINVEFKNETELKHKTELNHKTELKELKELSLKINHILHDQNNELHNINQNASEQEIILKNNLKKINKLVFN